MMQAFRRTIVMSAVAISMGTAILSGRSPVQAQSQLNSPEVAPDRQNSPTLDRVKLQSELLERPTSPDRVRSQSLQPLTLQQALELAQQNNWELQIAAESLKRSQADLQQTRATLFPTLSAQTTLVNDRTASDRLDNLEFLSEDATSGTLIEGSLELNYDLFTSGKRAAQIRAAKEQVRHDQLELERSKTQVYQEVANAYYDLQEADERVRIARAALENAERSIQDAIALEEGGRGTYFDVSRALVQRANTEQELTDAIVQQDLARRQLAQLLSLDETVEVTAADPIDPEGSWQLSLEESIVLAYDRRVELSQQLVQRNIATQRRRAALAGTKPQISLFANYQVLDDFRESFGLLDGYAVGTRLRWDFFDGGVAGAIADREEANQNIAELRFAQTRSQIRLQVERAYKTLRANARSIQTAATALKQARENLEVARLRFDADVGTQLEIIVAENDLTRAEVNRLRAILNYNRALIALQQATGTTLLDSDISDKPGFDWE